MTPKIKKNNTQKTKPKIIKPKEASDSQEPTLHLSVNVLFGEHSYQQTPTYTGGPLYDKSISFNSTTSGSSPAPTAGLQIRARGSLKSIAPSISDYLLLEAKYQNHSYSLELEEFRNSLTDIYTGEKKKITPLAFIVKALTASLKKFPNFNSSIDEIDRGKMTLKKYYHIGIAVDTKHGLMVPKLRNADNKNITLIGTELKKLSDQCRNLKIDKKELFGGSMTITSLGGIGGSFFTPIINYPEVAILGVGKSQKKQIFIDGKFITRTILPLSLSYDHRIIDGAEAARFNNDLKDNLGKNFAYKLAV